MRIQIWSDMMVAAAVLALAGVAVSATQADAAEAPQQATPDESGGALAEVVVTAEKRTEPLQKTAAAITALNADAIVAAGVTDIDSAQNLMPSVRFQSEGASTEIYIRGIGSTVDLPNNEPPTAFNFNGVYVPREGTSVGFYDVQRIELLPGPQGTLYGRSALGGAVNVSFARPTRDWSTSVSLETGNYSLGHVTVVQNAPVTDKLDLRAALDYVYHDGYQTTGADSQSDFGGRLSGLYRASDTLSVYLWAQMAEKHGAPENLVRKGADGGTGIGDPNSFETRDPWNDTLFPGAPTAGRQTYDNAMVGGEINWNVTHGITLTYIPSYFYLNSENNYWVENAPAFLSAHYNQITNELRAAGGSGRLNWIGGLYQYGVTNSGYFTIGGFPLTDIKYNRLEGEAAFGQVTYGVTGALRLIAGGRFSYDKRVGRGATSFGAPFEAHADFNHVDWKLGAEYDLRAETMLYATIQTGYQPGTYNTFPSTLTQSNLVRAADLTAYTVGAKNRFLNDHLQLNDEVFYYDYRNLFAQSTNLGTGLLTTFNAKKVEVYGNQLDVLFRVTPDDMLSLGVGYLHARNIDFQIPADIDVGTATRDFDGYQLQNAPDWTVSLGYHHDVHFDSGYVRASVDSRFEDSYWGGYAHTRGTQQQSYVQSDASITYYANANWSAGLWIKNIENRAVQAATAGGLGNWGATFLQPPRTFGVRASFGF